MVIEGVRLHDSVISSIKTHSIREAEKGNYEAVGFIACGAGSSIATAVMPLNNHAANPTEAFFVEPWEQFRAEKKLYEQGYEIVGVYHSHPTSEAIPSRSDRSMARPGELVLIYSVAFDDLRLWREQDGDLIEVNHA